MYAGCAGNGKCLICGYKHDGSHNITHKGKSYKDSWSDPYHTSALHYGVDIGAPKSSNVYASRGGIVYYHDKIDSGRGRYAIVEHTLDSTYSYYTLYQHLSKVNSASHKNGSVVSTRDVIGYVGGSGIDDKTKKASETAYGYHLHFEAFIGKKGGGQQLVNSLVDNCQKSGYYSTTFLKTSGIKTGLLVTNPKNSNEPSGISGAGGNGGSVTWSGHKGSLTYVFNKSEVPVQTQSTIANSTINKIPSTIKQGSAWTCDGTVSSNYKLKYVNGYIIKNTGKNSMWNDETKEFTVSGSDLKSGSKTYNLKNSAIDKGLLFNKLVAGNYYYVITARDETDAPLQVIQKFSVTANSSDTIAPTISNSMTITSTTEKATIECKVTDNVKVKQVRLAVWKANQSSTTYKWVDAKSVDGSKYTFEVNRADFDNYRGEYKANIHAWDTSDNKRMSETPILFNINQPTITNTKPSGVVDSVVCDTSGKIHVQGWAYDPDSKGTALDIHVYVGGPASPNVPCTVIKANLERKDVNKAFGCGDYHGFNAQISTNKLGSVPVYIYAIDTAGGNNPELGNRTVSVETEKPIGVFEKVESLSANKIHVVGWAYDPDTKDKAVTIAVYIGGQCNVAGVEKHEITANITRDDINKSKNCGSKHGFDAVITTQKRGVQGVYVWAHNTDGSPSNINTFLGNTDVNIHDCNAVIDHAVAATYETTGLTEGSHCSVCGKVIVAQEIIPKIVKDSSDDMKESEDDNKFYDDKEKITYDEGIDIDKEKLIYGDEYGDIDKEKQNLINNSSTTGKEDVSPQNVENDKKSLVDSSISQKNNNKAETDSSKSLGDKTSQSNVSSDDKTNTSGNVENEEEDEDDEFVIGNASYEIIAGNRVMLTSVKDEKLQSFNVPNTVTFNLKKYNVVCVFDEAFMNCKSLKKIVIGKNIEEIGDYAFKNCSSLKNITIKTTKLTKSSFGKKAFKGINKKATFKCPKKQYKNYKKWIKKAGAPKTAKYKK